MNATNKTLIQLRRELGSIQFAINELNWLRSQGGFKDEALELRHKELTKANLEKANEICFKRGEIATKRNDDANKRKELARVKGQLLQREQDSFDAMSARIIN